ncbi:MAG TPA: hypothetical protein EYN18_02785 [Nitrospirales bacterium]|nr:hypothetical protein [Nitrospirales bacterium]
MQKEAYKEGSAGGGSIAGKVNFSGPPPDPKPFTISKNPEVCGVEGTGNEVSGGQQYSENGKRIFHFTHAPDGILRHAVVFIDEIDGGKPWGDLGATMDIIGKDCGFFGYQNIVRDGTTVFEAVNEDAVLHNPHTFYFKGKARKTFFNVAMNPKGEPNDKLTFTFAGKMAMAKGKARIFKLECDQHDFMHAWGWNAANPYATVVADDGTYTLDGVADGTYNVCAWHPESGLWCDEVAVAGATTHDFTMCQKKDMKKGCK